ncbi:TetR family transcriptional regulator [Novosphingobium huizhouense]|uniref:TetR family transcriptional regulator n=1 Tax=Novosphingobium huizhouense TaxID=2866625 RepID=UPI001CD81CAC|nr:TetR family transcriptional regulator [Novosphingobium huizhouense]
MIDRETRRSEVEARLAAHVLAHGLSRTSLRDLARAAGTSDRMLLYYFADKAEILGVVLARIAADMAALLDGALPSAERLAPADLLARLGAMAGTAQMRPYMELWSEIAAGAARGEAPFDAIADAIAAGFRDWADARLAVADDAARARLAALMIVAVDGAALLAPMAGGAIARDGLGALADLLARYCS